VCSCGPDYRPSSALPERGRAGPPQALGRPPDIAKNDGAPGFGERRGRPEAVNSGPDGCRIQDKVSRATVWVLAQVPQLLTNRGDSSAVGVRKLLWRRDRVLENRCSANLPR